MPSPRWIHTETPEAEQWRLLGQYRYAPNIRRYLAERGLIPATADIEDYVSGSIGQADAFFQASKAAPLDITPLLIYYGSTSLLSGVTALLKGAALPITEHGMGLRLPASGRRVSDVEVEVRGRAGGGLRLFADVFGTRNEIPAGSSWSVAELLASLPDLKDDVRNALSATAPFALRVVQARHRGIVFDTIPASEFQGQPPNMVLQRVVGLRRAYLPFQQVSAGVLLYHRLPEAAISTDMVSGQKALLVGHDQSGRLCTPGQLLSMVMVLFVLGTLSRYHPTMWHPFVRTDSTGERLLVERFLSLAVRWLPNIALSLLTGESIRFTSAVVEPPRGLESMSEDELRQFIRDSLPDFRSSI